MKFMVIRKADAETEQGVMPTQELLSAMMAYNEKLINAGVMKDGYGLEKSSKGARVNFRGGKPTVVDGPFAETKELVAGFSILEVKSLEEALEWVKQWPTIDGHGNVEIEIRRVLEAEDFGAEFTDEMRAHEDMLRAKAAG